MNVDMESKTVLHGWRLLIGISALLVLSGLGGTWAREEVRPTGGRWHSYESTRSEYVQRGDRWLLSFTFSFGLVLTLGAFASRWNPWSVVVPFALLASAVFLHRRDVDQWRQNTVVIASTAVVMGVVVTRPGYKVRRQLVFVVMALLMLVVSPLAYDDSLRRPFFGNDGWSGYKWQEGRFMSVVRFAAYDNNLGWDEGRQTFHWQPVAATFLASVGVVIGMIMLATGRRVDNSKVDGYGSRHVGDRRAGRM